MDLDGWVTDWADAVGWREKSVKLCEGRGGGAVSVSCTMRNPHSCLANRKRRQKRQRKGLTLWVPLCPIRASNKPWGRVECMQEACMANESNGRLVFFFHL